MYSSIHLIAQSQNTKQPGGRSAVRSEREQVTRRASRSG